MSPEPKKLLKKPITWVISASAVIAAVTSPQSRQIVKDDSPKIGETVLNRIYPSLGDRVFGKKPGQNPVSPQPIRQEAVTIDGSDSPLDEFQKVRQGQQEREAFAKRIEGLREALDNVQPGSGCVIEGNPNSPNFMKPWAVLHTKVTSNGLQNIADYVRYADKRYLSLENFFTTAEQKGWARQLVSTTITYDPKGPDAKLYAALAAGKADPKLQSLAKMFGVVAVKPGNIKFKRPRNCVADGKHYHLGTNHNLDVMREVARILSSEGFNVFKTDVAESSDMNRQILGKVKSVIIHQNNPVGPGSPRGPES